MVYNLRRCIWFVINLYSKLLGFIYGYDLPQAGLQDFEPQTSVLWDRNLPNWATEGICILESIIKYLNINRVILPIN